MIRFTRKSTCWVRTRLLIVHMSTGGHRGKHVAAMYGMLGIWMLLTLCCKLDPICDCAHTQESAEAGTLHMPTARLTDLGLLLHETLSLALFPAAAPLLRQEALLCASVPFCMPPSPVSSFREEMWRCGLPKRHLTVTTDL